MVSNWEFEIVAGPYGSTTEGPVWDGQAILFTHLSSHRTLRYDPATGQTTDYITSNGRINGLCFGAEGVLYACQSGHRRIVRVEKDRSLTPLLHLLDGKRHNHPNDIAVDRKGRIWFSDPWFADAGIGPQEREIDHASVLCLNPKGDQWELVRATFDSGRPNGVLVSPDQKTLYVAECTNCPEPPLGSPPALRQLRAYPINDDGSLANYIVLHTFGVDHRGVHRGVDGMTFDSEGNIIAPCGTRRAGPGPMVYVFGPSGRVLETHPLPVDHPTNCCFGDADMRTFYMTTGEGYLVRARTNRIGWILWP
jgi:gluconolactonase